MSSEGSVSYWIGLLQAGNYSAAQLLWERYFQRLTALARHKLGDLPRRAADEEDVALSAFDSFCRGVERGRFPQLHRRDNLWRLLVVITARKAFLLRRQETRQKRGGRAAHDDVSRPTTSPEGEPSLDQLLGREPTPAFAAQMAEESQRLLGSLGDTELESVALWKMEGFTNQEIAGKLACGLRSVERKLRLIRTIWAQEIAS
jgi:DNA-directed RNA polymerase specialized sigma24 family protein